MATTESSISWSASYPVVQLEHAGLIGLFLRHDQRLEMTELQPTPPSSPAKRAKGVSSLILPANGTTTATATTVIRRRYDLNSKLFAIHEPYLMKTERDSLVKMINDKEMLSANGTTTAKTAANRAKKRKKAVTKKVSYLEQNLADDNERILAMRLIEQCLLLTAPPPPLPPPKASSKSPSKRKVSSSSTTATQICTPMGDKAGLLLRNINGDANGEAQKFVENLFRNRFESLNYRSKVFCNPYSRVLRVKIGLSNYLIPPRCSFAGIDICTGIQKLTADLKARKCHRSSLRDPFYIVLDPAWENNKSVKRKKTYETVSADYLRRMAGHLKELIDEVVLKHREPAEEQPETVPSVVVAVWTTRADKSFVLGQMLEAVGATLAYDLKWHKVTTSGCPVKVHGGLEYLIIAERWASSSSSSSTPPPVRPTKSGLLISVPSAVHSHKPSLVPIFRKLYHLDAVSTSTSSGSAASSRSSSVSRSPDYNYHEHGSLMNYNLAPDEIISPLLGVELFARYLQPGFHAIGFEAIKLQNEELFVEQS